MTALNKVRPARTTEVATSPVTTRLISAAASKMICMKSWYWRRNAWIADSFFWAVSLLGPPDWSRASASAAVSPVSVDTPNSFAVVSASTACHPPAFGRRVPGGALALEIESATSSCPRVLLIRSSHHSPMKFPIMTHAFQAPFCVVTPFGDSPR